MKLPVMTLGQAKKLAGQRFSVGSKEFVFDNELKAGGQAIAIPLKNGDGDRIAFFRSLFAMASTSAKTERTAWMIGQRLHLLSEAFIGAPQLWVNTKSQGRPIGVDFDFAGTIHGLALGTSWKSWKEDVEMGQRNEPGTDLRLQFAKGLVQRLACLEAVGRSGFVHGDVSDANVMLDDISGKVNLIDFDCFVFESPSLQRTRLLIRDGGSKGTPGYIPDWFSRDNSADLAPLGDRFARDMLLIELLGFREGDPIDLSPLYWTGQEELLTDIKNLATTLNLKHLESIRVFEAKEAERPSSFELADRLGLKIENNVQQALSSPPIMPFQSTNLNQPQSADNARREPTRTKEQTRSTPREIRVPTPHEFSQLLVKWADQAAIKIGRSVLPLVKLGISGLFGIAATVIWVLLFIFLLLKLSLPANLIVCGGLVYLTVWAYGKFKSSER